MEDIAKRIKQSRIDKGLKQKDFKEMIGMPPGQYSNIETGKNKPSITKFIAIAEALGVDVTWLATGHYTKLTTIQNLDILELFNQLTQEDQEEIKHNILYKLDKKRAAEDSKKKEA